MTFLDAEMTAEEVEDLCNMRVIEILRNENRLRPVRGEKTSVPAVRMWQPNENCINALRGSRKMSTTLHAVVWHGVAIFGKKHSIDVVAIDYARRKAMASPNEHIRKWAGIEIEFLRPRHTFRRHTFRAPEKCVGALYNSFVEPLAIDFNEAINIALAFSLATAPQADSEFQVVHDIVEEVGMGLVSLRAAYEAIATLGVDNNQHSVDVDT